MADGLGSSVLPDCEIGGGHPADLHADAAYNRAVGMYMITRWCFAAGVGRLYLHLSRDGIQFEPPSSRGRRTGPTDAHRHSWQRKTTRRRATWALWGRTSIS